jgi:hypothetical protein
MEAIGLRGTWRLKAALKRGMAMLPFGERLNYVFQRHVSGNLPHNETKFRSMVLGANDLVSSFKRYSIHDLRDATFYEFGAGWALTVPLTIFALGVGRQILVDIRRLVKPDLVNDTIAKFQRIRFDLPLQRLPGKPVPESGWQRFLSALQQDYGIVYRAPCDARATQLEARSVDCITSTNVLEHIRREDILSILRECHRILKDDGIVSCRIDYIDHYSHFDSDVSVYNFLRYSPAVWAFFSPNIYFQNRLRHPDYMSLYQEAGFAVMEERRFEAEASDLESLRALPLHRDFRHYSIQDLSVLRSLVVLRKRGGSAPERRREPYVFHG